MLKKFLQTSVLRRRLTLSSVLICASTIHGVEVKAATLGAPAYLADLGEGKDKGYVRLSIDTISGQITTCKSNLNAQGGASCDLSNRSKLQTMTVSDFIQKNPDAMLSMGVPWSTVNGHEVNGYASAYHFLADLAANGTNLNVYEVLNNSAYIIVLDPSSHSNKPGYKINITWWKPSQK